MSDGGAVRRSKSEIERGGEGELGLLKGRGCGGYF